MEKEKKWRALHTRKGAENKVCSFLHKLSLDCFHPKFGDNEKANMFKKNGYDNHSLLPSCVMVKCSDEDMRRIEHHADVYNSFYWLGRKVEMSESEITNLKKAVDSGYDYVPQKYQGKMDYNGDSVIDYDQIFSEKYGDHSDQPDVVTLPSLGLKLIRQNDLVSETEDDKEGVSYEKYYYWL
jgi:hypothetical protein